MLRAEVDLLMPDHTRVTVGHGALIGRLASAAVSIPDPAISEAHALVSLRGRQLRLLALRQHVFVDGESVAETHLQAGMNVHLAPDVALRVLDVRLPERVLAIDIPGVGRAIPQGLTSIRVGSPPTVIGGWVADADLTLWPDDGAWWGRGRDGQRVRVEPGATLALGHEVVTVHTAPLGADNGTLANTDFQAPCVLEVYFDTVQIKRQRQDVVCLTGKSARIVSELATAQAPLPWQDLATLVWGEQPAAMLRKRWDTHTYRLRRKLRNHGLSPYLVRADGTGLVELVLGANDTVVDRT